MHQDETRVQVLSVALRLNSTCTSMQSYTADVLGSSQVQQDSSMALSFLSFCQSSDKLSGVRNVPSDCKSLG